jgi:hypothetical protein
MFLHSDLGTLSGSRGLPVTLHMKQRLYLTPCISPILGHVLSFAIPGLCPSESRVALLLLCPLFG